MKSVKIASALGALAFGLTAAVVSATPAEAAASGKCTVSVNVWTNSDDEIISDARAVCNKAKKVTVRSRLYYCTWYNGSGRAYEVADSKTVKYSGTVTGTKKVTVVEKAMYGRWYAEAYVWYTKGSTPYAGSDLEFASVGSRPSGTDC